MISLDEWIHEEKKILDIHSKHKREPITYVWIYFYYISSGHIEKIVPYKHVFGDDGGMNMISLIQKNKYWNGKKYMFSDAFSYYIDIDSPLIDHYDYTNVLKKIDIWNTPSFPPSLFIFHSIHSICILFEKKENNRKTKKRIK
jgi:hypothetical protein